MRVYCSCDVRSWRAVGARHTNEVAGDHFVIGIALVLRNFGGLTVKPTSMDDNAKPLMAQATPKKGLAKLKEDVIVLKNMCEV